MEWREREGEGENWEDVNPSGFDHCDDLSLTFIFLVKFFPLVYVNRFLGHNLKKETERERKKERKNRERERC